MFIGFEKLRKHRRGRKHSKLRSPFFSPCTPSFRARTAETTLRAYPPIVVYSSYFPCYIIYFY
ncbi:hypothetical protein HMPREF1547_03543 [Blautia sp. KLE 1732]|nr:hypothetical protein HMPREF1547_03543 [Blautia sp. KLE 1732]